MLLDDSNHQGVPTRVTSSVKNSNGAMPTGAYAKLQKRAYLYRKNIAIYFDQIDHLQRKCRINFHLHWDFKQYACSVYRSQQHSRKTCTGTTPHGELRGTISDWPDSSPSGRPARSHFGPPAAAWRGGRAPCQPRACGPWRDPALIA
jgi:hypothetical protein